MCSLPDPSWLPDLYNTPLWLIFLSSQTQDGATGNDGTCNAVRLAVSLGCVVNTGGLTLLAEH